MQALTGSNVEDEDEYDEGGGGGGSGGGGTGTGGGGGASSSPPPATDKGGGGEPPASMQMAVSAAGLAALPVVAWSEWVLKSTGKHLRSRLPLPHAPDCPAG